MWDVAHFIISLYATFINVCLVAFEWSTFTRTFIIRMIAFEQSHHFRTNTQKYMKYYLDIFSNVTI